MERSGYARLSLARADFHRELIAERTLVVDDKGVASNADSSQRFSREAALAIATQLGAGIGGVKLDGQRAGSQFEGSVRTFIARTLPLFSMLRPARWAVENVGSSRKGYHLARFEPYRHLAELAQMVDESPTLAAVLGNAYDVSPDVIVIRLPVPDSEINSTNILVDGQYGVLSPIRQANQSHGIVHAVVSCKWTLRSDRAQNARTEALGVLRNRKGRAPHIAVVTGEPSPARIASLALGTGDVDTVYHFALPELVAATAALDNDESQSILETLISGKRLRDIADLPLDLCV
ncbi:MAG: restriction endonuclease [Actinobacteria bacterium]|nr:restriction endonuclease [Actinomycetota bacterium]